MWELQPTDGSWTWNKTGLAPMECDDEFGAIYAALGAGHAPDAYTRTDAAKDGLARLQGYLRRIPRPSLHHKAWRLWASIPLEDLMTPAERAQTIQDLLDRQRNDGGWSLQSLGDWKRLVAKANEEPAESDGYATGLILYVLRQAGVRRLGSPCAAAWTGSRATSALQDAGLVAQSAPMERTISPTPGQPLP
jgi:squalene-hopene/tetraprenyl-beta-curcumene cyclase